MPDAVVHRLVICRSHPAAVLLLRDDGKWHLPEVPLPERHTAEVEHVNAAVRSRWGLETTVLFGLEHATSSEGTRRAHALETHAAEAESRSPDGLPPAAATAWASAEALPAYGLAADDAEMVRRCLSTIATPALDGRGWTRPGWWPAARQWIEASTGAAEIVQTRAWESSCVARVCRRRSSTLPPAAEFFFKAVPASVARETGVTTYLSERGAPGAPGVVAADVGRRWLLMRAFHGRSLDDSREAADWQRAAATYGRLQASLLGREAELRAAGCGERRLDEIAAAIDPLLADTDALMPGHPEGLTREQIAALRHLRPALHQGCATLAVAGIPPSLDHGDLWPSNVLVTDEECTFIDWEDACVSPPFLSLAPFLAMHREWNVALPLEALASAYLEPFAALRPMRVLRRAFDAAMPLGFCELAIRYWRMPAAISALHPWMREMVPFFLRHVLASA